MPNPETENPDAITSKLVLDEADEMLDRAVRMIRRSRELADRATVIATREATGGRENRVAIALSVARFGGRVADLELSATRSLRHAREQLGLDLDDATEGAE